MVADPMVIFSPDIFAAQRTGGISRCMVELMRGLTDVGEDWHLVAGSNDNDLLRAAAGEFGTRVLGMRPAAYRNRSATLLTNELRFRRMVQSRRAPVVHRTYYPVVDLLRRRDGPRQVETLHDLWDERAGSRGGLTNRLKSAIKQRALARADAIVCVSEHTRTELIDVWPHLASRATVIPHGVRRLSDHPAFDYERRFFLFVGARQAYKNFATAVAGLRAANLPDHDLVCFGGGAFTVAERQIIDDAGLHDRVMQVNGNDDRLAGAYEGATAMLYPSAYEGFGLPLLEAMIHSCPVVASPLTSLPEVGGDAAIYADPRDTEAWAACMRQMADGGDLAATSRKRGRERAARFSWTATARAHRKLYAELR